MKAHETLFAHAVLAAPLTIGRKARFGDAFQAIAHNCLAHIRHNVPGVMADDPESLHQMRIGVRRLRALLEGTRSFGALPEDTAGKLQWLGQELGKARNWDVFLETTLPGLDTSGQAAQAMQQIAATARDMATEQRTHIRQMLEGARYRSLMEELALWDGERLWCDAGRSKPWDRDARKVAQALVRKCRERVGKRVRRLDPKHPESMHKLRIAVKEERYMREFFASLAGKDVGRRARTRMHLLSDAQDKLGVLNDAAIARDLLQSLQERLPAQATTLSFLAGLLAGRQEPAIKAAGRFARRKL
jgi:CHAD domain-containing protein